PISAASKRPSTSSWPSAAPWSRLPLSRVLTTFLRRSRGLRRPRMQRHRACARVRRSTLETERPIMSSSTVSPRPRPSTLAEHIGLSAKGMLLVAGILAMLMRPALIDPDYYWHVEAGRWIVMHGALPSADPFSFTARYPWVTHEWLFEVFLYGV